MLSVVDAYTRECLTLEADTSLGGGRVTRVLESRSKSVGDRKTCVRTTDLSSPHVACLWAEDWSGAGHIRPGRPIENGHIESFNGKLRDECLNVEVFFTLADARRKLALWRHDYNHHRPYSAIADRTPNEFATICSGGKRWRSSRLGKRRAFPTFPPRGYGWVFSEERSALNAVAGGRHLSYSNCKSAGKSGTNRTTQAEISNLLRLSFPGRVKNRESPVMTG